MQSVLVFLESKYVAALKSGVQQQQIWQILH